MNTRGQAYSTFKLLIAAIVAVAVLYILIQIIMLVILPGNDIQQAVTQRVQNLSSKLAQVETTGNVLFKQESSLSATALVQNSGLSADQVCIHKGDHADKKVILVTENSLYNTGPQLELRASVVCNLSKDLLKTINGMPLGYEVDFDGDEGFCSCPLDDETATQKCCAVILRYAS